ncbi:hypothetical protein [Methylobacterium oxalidis]|uniref:Uncharacterized protein n=1 Tax=Methylobacterium oxalidis TaxID=944322 RepID=A0A512J1L3_9HYPH|nr:hypothetical protein [Methylobacterium oxalidis]GEP03854.1 hypothetical protein MOX02_18920 [Methylobacterium oxalidis]GJE31272.1 hypothetical protein LDDCCGHA_1449 [Methylobacterium oxalidis]GLS65288.1 hypothetical protein GCM10007888_36700 [Methylobacterium oxalidis]
MALKYVFDVDAHTMQCLFTFGYAPGRFLETFCYSRPLNEGGGWRYLGNSVGVVIALVDPALSRTEAAQRLRILHDEVRDNGIREHEFKREDRYNWIESKSSDQISNQKLIYTQDWLARPAAMFVKSWGNRIMVEHNPLYWCAFWPNQIELRSVLTAYEVALAIGRGTPATTVMRRLRRFIRHVERFGLEECNTPPFGPRDLGYSDH